MRIFTILIISIILFTQACKTSSHKQNKLIPSPANQTLGDGKFLLKKDTLWLWCDTELQTPLLHSVLSPQKPILQVTNNKSEANILVIIDKTINNSEGYNINITKKGIQIAASSSSGAFYAIQTLYQLFQNSNSIACQTISDAPAFEWRGMHLDVSRHFFEIDFLKKYIDVLAFYKLNKLHLHLTDDQGWRMEIKKYPELTTKGAWRKGTVNDKWTFFTEPAQEGAPKYGGYYTQKQLKELVQYAAERNIEIIPEIEMPGHTWAALFAYPQLSCSGVPFKKPSNVPFAFTDPFCAGNPATYQFLQDVLDEVMEVFPSKYIHIGGDEVKFTPWENCTKCNKLAKSEGMHSSHELQGYFMNKIANYVLSKNRIPMGWDEIAESDVSKEVIITAWQNIEAVELSLEKGYKTVLTPSEYFYFNKYQFNPEFETISEAGGEPIPFDSVYNFKHIKNMPNIIGFEACLWTEYITNEQKVFTQIFPRLFALSELAWSNPEVKNNEIFRHKVVAHFEMLKNAGIDFFVEPPKIDPDSSFFMLNSEIQLINPWQSGTVYYRTNPSEEFIKYKSPFHISESSTIETYLELNDGIKSIVNKSFIEKLKWIEPTSNESTKLQKGYLVKYKTDSVSTLENYLLSTPDTVFISDKVAIPNVVRPDWFTLEFSAYLNLSNDAIIEMQIKSDDGSMVYLHDHLIINNDGVHGVIAKTKTVALKKGLHPIKIQYFEGNYGEKLDFTIVKHGKTDITIESLILTN
ncbi:MAG: family 20 glycosylhydrolase [Prolixibacteraceae bacterium]